MTAAILMMIGWLTLPGPAAAGASSGEAPCLGAAGPKPKVLVLGVFHMDNPNLDYVKSTAEDVLSPHRQKEITELTERLETFRPTKIALESPYGTADLQKKYDLYRDGKSTLGRDEREQLGFRLAAQLHHTAVYPVDSPRDMDIGAVLQAAASNGQDALAKSLQEALECIGRLMQSLSTKTLLEQLRFHNGPESQRLNRLYMLLAEAGDAKNPVGVEQLSGWYDRNLRIAANVLRLASSPDDRILVLFGSGHGPLLRHYLSESPRVELVDVAPFLK
jgi:hypothetical protein